MNSFGLFEALAANSYVPLEMSWTCLLLFQGSPQKACIAWAATRLIKTTFRNSLTKVLNQELCWQIIACHFHKFELIMWLLRNTVLVSCLIINLLYRCQIPSSLISAENAFLSSVFALQANVCTREKQSVLLSLWPVRGAHDRDLST